MILLLFIIICLFVNNVSSTVYCQCAKICQVALNFEPGFGESAVPSCKECTKAECQQVAPCAGVVVDTPVVECASSVVSWNGDFKVEEDAAKTSQDHLHCDQKQCCCPTGDFTISNFDAKAKTAEFTAKWVGNCGNMPLNVKKLSFSEVFETSAVTSVLANAGPQGTGGAFYVRKTDQSIIFSMSEINPSAGDCGFTLLAPGGMGGGFVFLIILIVLFVCAGGVFMGYRYKTQGKFISI